jgi:hypothetical protein
MTGLDARLAVLSQFPAKIGGPQWTCTRTRWGMVAQSAFVMMKQTFPRPTRKSLARNELSDFSGL